MTDRRAEDHQRLTQPGWISRLIRVVRQCPLTAVLAIGLLLGAIASDTLTGRLDEAWCLRWGYAPALIGRQQWYRPFTALMFTAGAAKFYVSFLMLIACVGSAEYLFGTVRALLTFVGTHLATLTALLLLLSLATWMGNPWAKQLTQTCDVGPSAGYYGCLGLVIGLSKSRLRRIVFAAIMTPLVIRVIVSAEYMPASAQSLSADLAHLLAVPIGYGTKRWPGSTRNLESIPEGRPMS